jgi:23S rRNA pseudouridine2605 synthase
VRANGRVTQDMLDRLSRGMKVEGIKYGPIQATLDREQGANVWLTLGLREGKNREVRNVLRELGLSVNRLIRVSYGPFQLRELAPAAVEEVNMRVLREQIGEKVERRAGVDFSAPLREQESEPSQKPPRPSSSPSHLKPGSPDFRSSKTNSGKPEFGKASRSSPASPPARGRWKSKKNVVRGRGPQK